MAGKRNRAEDAESEGHDIDRGSVSDKRLKTISQNSDQMQSSNGHADTLQTTTQTKLRKLNSTNASQKLIDLTEPSREELKKRAEKAERKIAELEKEKVELRDENEKFRQQVADLHSRLLENGRSQGRSYMLDDSQIQKNFKFLIKKINDWAASVARKGSLDDHLTMTQLSSVIQLLEGRMDDFPYHVVAKPKMRQFREMDHGFLFLVQAIVHHIVMHEIVGRPFHFLDASSTLPASRFEEVLRWMQGDDFEENLWYSRTLRALYNPKQYEGMITEPIQDDKFPKSRKTTYENRVDDLLRGKEALLINLLSDSARKDVEVKSQELNDIFAAAGKLSLQLWVQDLQVSVQGLKSDKKRKGFELGDDNVVLHYLCKEADTSNGLSRQTLALLVRPQVKCERYDPGGRRPMKMNATKALVVLPLDRTSQRDTSKSSTPNEMPPEPQDGLADISNEPQGSVNVAQPKPVSRAAQPITQDGAKADALKTVSFGGKMLGGKDEGGSQEKESSIDHVAGEYRCSSHEAARASTQNTQPDSFTSTANSESIPTKSAEGRVCSGQNGGRSGAENGHVGISDHGEGEESRKGNGPETLAQPPALVPSAPINARIDDDVLDGSRNEFEKAVEKGETVHVRRINGKLHAYVAHKQSGKWLVAPLGKVSEADALPDS